MDSIMEKFKNIRVGELVAQNIAFAEVLAKYNVDFCCGGEVLLTDAIEQAGASVEEVFKELETLSNHSPQKKALDFKAWSLDLLIDYVVKYHHRFIRESGPELIGLLERVVRVHGGAHPELLRVQTLFSASLQDLESHLDKEELVLFPLIREFLEAEEEKRAVASFHCGTVNNPIEVMKMEHDNEGERFREISKLTNGYLAPQDACDSYRLLMRQLEIFEENLHLHIHVENNILFPKAILLEERVL